MYQSDDYGNTKMCIAFTLVVVGMNKTCTVVAELMVDDLAFFRM